MFRSWFLCHDSGGEGGVLPAAGAHCALLDVYFEVCARSMILGLAAAVLHAAPAQTQTRCWDGWAGAVE